MKEIVTKLKNNQMFITPEAKKKINDETELQGLLDFLKKEDIVFIDSKIIESYKKEQKSKKITKNESKTKEKSSENLDNTSGKAEKTSKNININNISLSEYPKTDINPKSSQMESDFRLINDINGKSYTKGEKEDFLSYFNDRYKKISKILKSRLNGVIKAKHLRENSEEDTLIGMVKEVREANNGLIIELDDRSKSFRGFVNKKSEAFDKATKIVQDEVIAVTGNPQSNNFMYINDITFPDVKMPENREKRDNNKEVYAAFLSDLHFGSHEFLADAFEKFIEWINCETNDKIVEKLKYIVIAGDIVDGVGIYPDQEEDLLLKDIYKQYKLASEYLECIPDHIEIIISPGNHDATRRAEPQTKLDKDIAAPLFQLDNVSNIGNPALISINDKKILIYHGGSMNPMANNVSNLSNDQPDQIMRELVKKRHLNPIYGGYPIIPEEEDLLVIEDIPDIIHSGHVHVYGDTRYRGILLINSATWQTQTDFQRRMNLNPTPSRFPVVDLSDGTIKKVIDFEVEDR